MFFFLILRFTRSCCMGYDSKQDLWLVAIVQYNPRHSFPLRSISTLASLRWQTSFPRKVIFFLLFFFILLPTRNNVRLTFIILLHAFFSFRICFLLSKVYFLATQLSILYLCLVLCFIRNDLQLKRKHHSFHHIIIFAWRIEFHLWKIKHVYVCT